MNDGPRGWFARPWLSALLALVWLALQASLALPHVIAAVAIGLVVPRLVAGFLGPAVHLRAGAVLARLALVVLWDIVVANLAVARIVIDPRVHPRPAWLRVRLTLEQPDAIALLATIVTITPGTVACVIDEARGDMWVHALDCDDPAAMALQIRQRYEAPLKEVFR